MDASRVPADRGDTVGFTFEGQQLQAFEGETVATALLANGVQDFGITRDGAPRAPYCNMGTCFDCVVTVDGVPLVRSCITDVTEGCDVKRTEASS